MNQAPPAFTVDLAAAVNDLDTLSNCLARSPDVRAGRLTLRTYESYATAGAAYNRALDETDADILVLAHQDVYLGEGFLTRLLGRIEDLAERDPDWAACGVIGKDEHGEVAGQTWSSGIGRIVGQPLTAPVPVETLDEMLLMVRRASGVRFDEQLPSFHLYGTDIVQLAKAKGLKSYAIDLPVVHHSRSVVNLGGGYRAAYRYMQRKWRATLPIPNLVCPLEASPVTLIWRDLRLRYRARGRVVRVSPTSDPAEIARRIGADG